MTLLGTYTVDKLVENEAAQILRDAAGPNRFGNRDSADWQPAGDPVPCSLYWRKESGRGPSKKVASAQREVGMTEGGLIFAPGTDVRPTDRIGAVLDVENLEGEPIVPGPLEIQAVFKYGDHVEIAFITP